MAIPSRPSTREPIENWHTNPRLVSGRANKQVGVTTLLTSQQGIPIPVNSLSGTKSLQVVGGQTYVRVALSHKINPTDTTFSHAQVWVKGFLGNQNFQLLSASEQSPHTLLLPQTGDNVTFAVRSAGHDGSLSPLDLSPTHSLQLS